MDKEISTSEDHRFIPATSIRSGKGIEVLPDVFCYTIQIVNICLIGQPKTNEFVLIDTGVPTATEEIIHIVENRFGPNQRPQAIILTHGHFDHVGTVIDLVKFWQVPVYAHPLELPFLTGQKSYPVPDATVEGGMVAKMSPLFPHKPINLGDYVQSLPAEGQIPHLPDFRWIHTPGHSPGHISLFREKDRTLIAGDAFVTVRQDALYKVFTQKMEINGPPRYLTTDWTRAKDSVRKLAALRPSVAVTGHGVPVSGEVLHNGLQKLAQDFEKVAIPDYGRFVNKNLH